MKNNMKKLGALLMMAGLVGCATIDGTAKKQLELSGGNKKYDKYAYGLLLAAATKEQKIKVCAEINNVLPECANEELKLTVLQVSFGYADGGRGLYVFIPKELKYVGCGTSAGKECTYAKIEVNSNGFGKYVEVASAPNENKCKWSGMPRLGGVVCPAYDWRYDKANLPTVRNF